MDGRAVAMKQLLCALMTRQHWQDGCQIGFKYDEIKTKSKCENI